MLNSDQSESQKATNATSEDQCVVECASHRSLFGTQLDPIVGKPAKSEGALSNDDCADIKNTNNPLPAQDLAPMSSEEIAADINRQFKVFAMHMKSGFLAMAKFPFKPE